ncbi:AGAP010148-PA [Anopheles gambiae str. PEST]|uniref:AGAP010148-PA n=1 Tax=Anopheles gambiae TaxID=7165 RepID=A0NG30_ANOGA|nr:AGAP010148-PA [Anopheles gambiae str. PEST]
MFSFCFSVLHLLPSGIDFRSLCFCVFFFCIWRVQGTPRVAVGFSSGGPHVVAVDFQGDRIRFNRSSSDRHTSNTGVQKSGKQQPRRKGKVPKKNKSVLAF